MMYPLNFDNDGEKCPHFDYQCKLNFEKIELIELPKKSSTLPISLQAFNPEIVPLAKDSGFGAAETQ